MVRELKVRTIVLIVQGLLMIGLGLALFWMSSTMTNILFEVAGCVAAVFLTAACLLLVGVIDCIGGLTIHKGHRRELHIYLLFGATSTIAGLFFWLSPVASVQILVALAGLQGLFLGVWDLRVASHLTDHARERRALHILGGITVVLGLLLVASIKLGSRMELTLLAGYLTYIGIHLLMIGLYTYRPWKDVPHLRKSVDGAPYQDELAQVGQHN